MVTSARKMPPAATQTDLSAVPATSATLATWPIVNVRKASSDLNFWRKWEIAITQAVVLLKISEEANDFLHHYNQAYPVAETDDFEADEMDIVKGRQPIIIGIRTTPSNCHMPVSTIISVRDLYIRSNRVHYASWKM